MFLEFLLNSSKTSPLMTDSGKKYIIFKKNTPHYQIFLKNIRMQGI